VDNPFAPSDEDDRPLPARRATGLGLLALALGLWTGCGSCLGVFSALSGAPPDDLPPFLSPDQGRAALDFALAASALGPIDGAIALAATLTGLALLAAAVLGLARHTRAALGLRVAFLVSAAVDALQALWMVAWFALLWSDFTAYTRALMESMPTGQAGDIDAIVSFAIVVTIVLGLGYFAIKIGVAAVGAWLAGNAGPPAAEATPIEGAGWAD